MILGLVGTLFLVPGFYTLIQSFGSQGGVRIPMAIFYATAIVFGIVGSAVSIKRAPPAGTKALAVATLPATLAVLLHLYLLMTSADGPPFRYTAMGLLFMAMAVSFASSQKR